MLSKIFSIGIALMGALFSGAPAAQLSAQHSLITQGNGKLAIVSKSGEIDWQLDWNGIHDIHVLPSGNILTRQGVNKVVEISRSDKSIVWTYDSSSQNGNAGKPVEVHAFQPLEGGAVMIAESGPARIIEVDRDGKLLFELKLKIDHPGPHTDTRLARKLSNGHYLVCHEADGFVREYAATGEVVWEFEIPMFDRESQPGHGPDAFGNKVFAAVRLPNGNTLIATGNGHSVLEVSPEKKIIWELHQHDLEGIVLAWVTTLEVLPNGNYVIGNCHAGPEQPLLIEVNPATKKVVWQFDGFETFGNSVSNSQLLDTPASIR